MNKKVVWNADRTVGPREAFTEAQIDSLLDYLMRKQDWHDLAMFSTGFDTMLRGVDLLALRVRDVQTPTGNIRPYLYRKQQKAKRGVQLVLTDLSRNALAVWIEASGKRPEDFLFTRRKDVHGPPISSSAFRLAIKQRARDIGLDSTDISGHSLRRSKAISMYDRGCPIADISKLLGHKDIATTMHYLGITDAHLRAQAVKYDIFSTDKKRRMQQILDRHTRGKI